MQIESADHGPGIPNLQQALDDGYSTGGSLGDGLGAVNRFMDDLEIQSTPAGGTRLVCRRWLRPSCREVYPHWLDFGVTTRSCGLARENGDAFVVKCWPQHALVGVIDGLGHGQFAQQAALAARLYVEDHFDQPLDHLFVGTDRACHGTRGVVMALAHFDLSAGHFKMASIGNIEARLRGSPHARDFIVRRGIVGAHAQHAVVTEHHWTPDSILVLHSDGLHTHWTWDDFPQEAWQAPAQAAQLLLRRLGKDDDDATVLVVKSAAHDI